MKKICLVTIDLSLVGGVTKVTLDLAKDFVENGHEVTVCGIVNGGKKPFYSTKNLNVVNLFEDNIRMKDYIIQGRKKLKNILIENEIDIVLLQGEAAGIVGGFTRMIHAKPRYIYCDHGALTYDIHGFSKYITNLELFFCGHFCDESIFETEKGALKYRRMFRVGKTHYIYNYFNDNIVQKSDTFNRKILTVGRLTSQKGYDLLVEVASRIKSSHDWKWYIIGDGELRSFLEKRIKENNLENKLILKGNISDIYKEYSKYDLMVCTSRHEGLPLALIEGKAAKLPIISFDIETGPSEIIEDNITGDLIKPFDIDGMAEKISLLLNDDVKYSRYYRNIDQYLQKFSKSNVLKEWEKLICDKK